MAWGLLGALGRGLLGGLDQDAYQNMGGGLLGSILGDQNAPLPQTGGLANSSPVQPPAAPEIDQGQAIGPIPGGPTAATDPLLQNAGPAPKAPQQFSQPQWQGPIPQQNPAGIVNASGKWEPSKEMKRMMRASFLSNLGSALSQGGTVAQGEAQYRNDMLSMLSAQNQAAQARRQQQVIAGFSQDLQTAGNDPRLQQAAFMKWLPYDPEAVKAAAGTLKDFAVKPKTVHAQVQITDQYGNPMTRVIYSDGSHDDLRGGQGDKFATAQDGTIYNVRTGEILRDPTKTPSNWQMLSYQRAFDAAKRQGKTDDEANDIATKEVQRDPNETEATLALRAAKGDLVAKAALEAMKARPPSVSVNLQQERFDQGNRNKLVDYYRPAMDSTSRFNVMAELAPKAMPRAAGGQGDQQAMLGILAAHLGMTMGDVKGGRLNQAVINDAVRSQPWLQGMLAKFDDRGILTGIALSKEQIQQMVDLARTKFGQDVQKAGSDAEYAQPGMGGLQGGPKRTPNKAVISYYMGLTKGNVADAQKMMRDEGWNW